MYCIAQAVTVIQIEIASSKYAGRIIKTVMLDVALILLSVKCTLCIPGKEIAQPNFHIHFSVSNLYIPRIGPHIFLQQNKQTNRVNI
jgi:hypothetical protein